MKEALAAYGDLRRPARSSAHIPLTTILHRYSRVWSTESVFRGGAAVPPATPVPTTATPSLFGNTSSYLSFLQPRGRMGPWLCLRELALHSSLYRLNYVKQLSTINIRLHLEATHNRFSHLLGTLDATAFILETISASAPDAALPSPQWALATLLYALLHDAYHGPMGHSLDRIADLVLPDTMDTRLDKYLLHKALQEASKQQNGDIWNLAHQLCIWVSHHHPDTWNLRTAPVTVNWTATDERANEVLDSVQNFARRGRWLTGPNVCWLQDTIDGRLDADRIDYLLRDTAALGRREDDVDRSILQPTVIEGLIQRARLVLAPPSSKTTSMFMADINAGYPRAEGADLVWRLAWDYNDLPTIRRLLRRRKILYDEVYEAPDKRRYDESLAHALVWFVRDELGRHKSQMPGGSMAPSTQDILQTLAHLSDDELFHLFYELGTVPENHLALALVHDLARGEPFATVWRLGLERGLAPNPEVRAKILETEAALDPVFDATGVPTPSQQPPPRFDRAAIDALLFEFQQYCGRNFTRREELEHLLWRELTSGADALTKAIRRTLEEVRYQSNWAGSSDKVEKPLFFLSVPWIGSTPRGAQHREWRDAEALILHIDGAFELEPEEAPIVDARQTQEIVAYLPPALASIPGVRERVNQLMWKLLYSKIWLRRTTPKNQQWPRTAIPADCSFIGIVR